jgi:DNA-binding MarR family transcriptional regulator
VVKDMRSEGMKQSKLSLEQIKLLTLINEIAQNNEYNVAPVQEIIKRQDKVKPATMRKMIHMLYKQGYVENPFRGCWKLSKTALELIKV